VNTDAFVIHQQVADAQDQCLRCASLCQHRRDGT
jgi:hypothetical protein